MRMSGPLWYDFSFIFKYWYYNNQQSTINIKINKWINRMYNNHISNSLVTKTIIKAMLLPVRIKTSWTVIPNPTLNLTIEIFEHSIWCWNHKK